MTRMMLWWAYTTPYYIYDTHTLLTRSQGTWRQRFSVVKIGFLYSPGFWQRSHRRLSPIWESWGMLLWKVFLFYQLYNVQCTVIYICIIYSSLAIICATACITIKLKIIFNILIIFLSCNKFICAVKQIYILKYTNYWKVYIHMYIYFSS